MKQVYVALLRGINVGGNNKISMAELKKAFESLGHEDVRTYINSGNVVFTSTKSADSLATELETMLPTQFRLGGDMIRVLVLSLPRLQAIVDAAPKGFGADPATYYSDAIFLIGIPASEAFAIFDPREGVDAVWQGDGVIYSQRLGAERTKSRLSKIIASPLYKQMTIRSWGTTTKLLALMQQIKR